MTDRDAETHWKSYGKHARVTTCRYRLTEALGILADLTPRGDTLFADRFIDVYKRLVRFEITFEQAHELVLHLEDG